MSRWKNLSLTEVEGSKVDLTRDKKKVGTVLAAKFFTRRNVNVEVVAKTFRPIWQTKGNFEVCDGKDNVLLIAFELEVDAEKVLQGQPWAFDRHLVVLQRYDGSEPVHHLVFKSVTFWVQIHNLPFQLLTVEAALSIREMIGKVSRPKDIGEMKGGNFMRVRVEVKLRNHSTEVGKSHGINPVRVGQRLCMNICQTYATGVDLFHMTTKIVIYG